MNLLDIKIVVMVITGGISFTVGMLPYIFHKCCYRTKQKVVYKIGKHRTITVLSLLLCFGGGVLMATSFAHILPEALESFNKLVAAGDIFAPKVPWIEITMCCGFFMIYLLEEIIHMCLHNSFEEKVSVESSLPTIQELPESQQDEEEGNRKQDNHANVIRTGSVSSDSSRRNIIPPNSNNQHKPVERHHSHVSVSATGKPLSKFRQLITILALSAHAVFEGLAVGLQQDADSVWYMFGAISSHKYIISFCVGTEFVNVPDMSVILLASYIFTFAAVTPLGIGIGAAISNFGSASGNVVVQIFQALAAGTLLYVIFFEVLERERARTEVRGIYKLIAMMSGFALMVLIGGLTAGMEKD